MQLGLVGLGRFGHNMVRRLAKAGHDVFVTGMEGTTIQETVAYPPAKAVGKVVGAVTPKELVSKMKRPRAIWLMIPAGVTDRVVDVYTPLLEKGDILIDGGNSYYVDDIRRSKELKAKGIDYIDVGTSGGVWGLLRGYCLMIGGDKAAVDRLGPIFKAIAPGQGDTPPTKVRKVTGAEKDAHGHYHAVHGPEITATGTSADGYLHCGPSGAGHFAKMVLSALDQGLLAAYAEAFSILKHADRLDQDMDAVNLENTSPRNRPHYQYNFNLRDMAELWRRCYQLTTLNMDCLAMALAEDSELRMDAQFVHSGGVPVSPDTLGAIRAAVEEGVPSDVLTAALASRLYSQRRGEFAWKVIEAVHRRSGGHE